MSEEPPELRWADFQPGIAAWKWLLWAALGLFFFNALAGQWGPWPQSTAASPAMEAGIPIWMPPIELLPFEAPSRLALADGHSWTLLTYSLLVTHWFWGPMSLLFLWVLGQKVEADMSRSEFCVSSESLPVTFRSHSASPAVRQTAEVAPG